jgi:hypothetical protein
MGRSIMHQLHAIPEENRTANEQLLIETAVWIHGLAPWRDFATLTFVAAYGVEAARKGYERFMNAQLPTVSHFYAIEPNPSRDGHHVHAIWTDPIVKRKTCWSEWFTKYGRARIEPIGWRVQKDRGGYLYDSDGLVRGRSLGADTSDSLLNVADYVAKYLIKDRSWWDVRLKGGHHPNAHVQEALVLR